MSTTLSVCSIVVMVVAALITLYSFYQIFQSKLASENDLNVIQRQLRGFALLLVGNLVMVLGMIVCTGNMLPALVNKLR